MGGGVPRCCLDSGPRWRFSMTQAEVFHERRCFAVLFESGSRWRFFTTPVEVFHGAVSIAVRGGDFP